MPISAGVGFRAENAALDAQVVPLAVDSAKLRPVRLPFPVMVAHTSHQLGGKGTKDGL